jgi:endonuclease/exonuclease/phosphatase family metal-dependent hydrolase
MLGEKRTRRALALVVGCAVAATSFAIPAAAGAKPVDVKVMTRNLYLGADLTPAIAAPDPPAARIAAGDIYKDVVDTNFDARAKLLAEEIRRTKPHLIGLQELSLWRRGQRGEADGSATPSTEVVYDYLDILRHEMQRLGLRYRVVSLQQEADMEFAISISGDDAPEFDGRLTMRDAILARSDVKTKNNQHANFDARLEVSLPVGDVAVLRGWNSIDVRKVGRKKANFRFVNTHLESFVAATRTAQATELIGDSGAVDTNKPVILLGDLNSDPDDSDPNGAAAYNLIVGNEYAEDGGFADRGVEENTCCFSELVFDAFPDFGSRIDHVLSRGRVSEQSSRLIGVDPDLRTNTGLWPSDHGGVVAKLRVR